MSPQSSMLRLIGAAFIVGLLSVAACAGEGDVRAPASEDGGLPPEAGSTDAGAPDTPDNPLPDARPKCGNFKVEPGETCDDGNSNDNDGCSGSCKLESAFEGDICPGKSLVLQTSGSKLHASVSGSTKTAYGQYGSACGGGSGKDVVYTFTPSSSGKAVVKLTADYPAIVSARSTCDVATSESKCADIAAPTGGTTTIEVPAFQNTPVFLFVDGYGGTSGDYTLDVEISLAACGNGIAELPEACDDGNNVDGDGCSATCTLESGGTIKQCPGQPFLLTGPAGQPRKISFAGNTLTDGEATQGATGGCVFSNGVNVVYALKSDVTGAVKAELLTAYAKSGLHARSDCGDSDYQLACTQRDTPGASKLEFPVKANEWFYLFVDGYQLQSNVLGGPYTLDVTLTPAECGNHVLDGDEQCDDGNTVAGDGCAPGCVLEPVTGIDLCPGRALDLTPQPDGSRNGRISASTVGLANNHTLCNGSSGPDAVFAVTPDIDGYLTANVKAAFRASVSIRTACSEKLEDGGAAPGTNVLACSYKLAAPSSNQATQPWVIEGVGNGPKSTGTPVLAGQTYWLVVDGASSDAGSRGVFELDVRVRPPTCGNGILEGAETCDDGGTDDGDGCDATCKVEPITSRSTCSDAEAITLVETAPGTYAMSLASGTTNLLANSNMTTSSSSTDPCFAPGRNAFFKVTAPTAGVLRATAKSSAFDVVLNYRKPTCALLTAPFMCANNSERGNEETLATPVAAGEIVYVVVDSKGANDFGRFTLDVSLTPSGCGDGFFVPSATEECDDGNNVSGDGCSATCKVEPITGVDKCPGKTLTLSGVEPQPRKGLITFDTSKLDADYSGTCGGNARDGVVRIVAPVDGLLRAKLRNMPNATLHARSICTDPTTELSKSDYSTCPRVVHDPVTFSVKANNEYFLFVDGLDGAVGVPTLDVTIDP